MTFEPAPLVVCSKCWRRVLLLVQCYAVCKLVGQFLTFAKLQNTTISSRLDWAGSRDVLVPVPVPVLDQKVGKRAGSRRGTKPQKCLWHLRCLTPWVCQSFLDVTFKFRFIFIYKVSITNKIVSWSFSKTQSLTPNKQDRDYTGGPLADGQMGKEGE